MLEPSALLPSPKKHNLTLGVPGSYKRQPKNQFFARQFELAVHIFESVCDECLILWDAVVSGYDELHGKNQSI